LNLRGRPRAVEFLQPTNADTMDINHAFRARISAAVCQVLQPLPEVVAGWEGGSAAFDALDGYSDIDLNYLVVDSADVDRLYRRAEQALATVSPIVASHSSPPGRYYQLKDAGEFLLVDLIIVRTDAPEQFLGTERHGNAVPLFDKGTWLCPSPLDQEALAAKRIKRYRELQTWFSVSQGFVWKAIRRGRHAEAVGAFWAYTLRPLAELLRMRYCPVRWDFGVRYLDRDLPSDVYSRFRDLTFVRDLDDLEAKLAAASAWGSALLRELEVSGQVGQRDPTRPLS
jgi:hypothetical protein